MMLGIIGGTSLVFSSLPSLEKRSVHTPFGSAEILAGDVVILMRHQNGRPPHRINFRANLAALALSGVDRVVALGSAGSLKSHILPGSLLIPTDYISLAPIPSIHDHATVHVSPGISGALSARLAALVPGACHGGTYAQTEGPRIETVAEVRVLSGMADVVGMTVGSEATLADELGLEFAALCTVDNFAHGLGGEALTFEHILATSKEYSVRNGEIIERIIHGMG